MAAGLLTPSLDALTPRKEAAMTTFSPPRQLLDNGTHNQLGAGNRPHSDEALAARRGSRERAEVVLMGRGRALALAAVLAAMVCGCFAAQADAFVYWT